MNAGPYGSSFPAAMPLDTLAEVLSPFVILIHTIDV